MQDVLPKDNVYFNIVDLIKHMILLYYYQMFDTELLVVKQKLLGHSLKILAKFNTFFKKTSQSLQI